MVLGNRSWADFPDTMVAALNSAGFIIDFNNDGGPWEGALGSGLTFIPINNDSSFWFIVTGFDDFGFQGNHDQSGAYHVYVDIYNDFNEYEETFEYDDFLEPNEVDSFSLDGFNTNYTYDVFIDNTVGGASNDGDFDSDGDVDGRDFLRWQRGNSPSPFSSTDLAAWQAGYGTPLVATLGEENPTRSVGLRVPEPGTWVLIGLAVCGCGVRRMLGLSPLSRKRLRAEVRGGGN
jgi:hypothetical protein